MRLSILISAFVLFVNCQWAKSQSQRTVLTEHFCQASCPPCATTNPPFYALLDSNQGNVVNITMQVAWPGIDPMNADYPEGPMDRVAYYSIVGVPVVSIDGGVSMHTANVTDSMLNTAIAVPSPFDLAVTHTVEGGQINAQVDLACSQNISGNLILHIVVIEKEILFSIAPGTNGETEFQNIMKQMLPNTYGTTLSNSWTVGQSQTISESWTFSNVYDENQLAVVAFVQDDFTKEVHQAGYSAPLFVGIEADEFSELIVYPNPSDGDFAIDLGNTYVSITVKLTDLNGKVIKTNNYNTTRFLHLKIEEPVGIYLLNIETEAKKAIIILIKE